MGRDIWERWVLQEEIKKHRKLSPAGQAAAWSGLWRLHAWVCTELTGQKHPVAKAGLAKAGPVFRERQDEMSRI